MAEYIYISILNKLLKFDQNLNKPLALSSNQIASRMFL